MASLRVGVLLLQEVDKPNGEDTMPGIGFNQSEAKESPEEDTVAAQTEQAFGLAGEDGQPCRWTSTTVSKKKNAHR